MENQLRYSVKLRIYHEGLAFGPGVAEVMEAVQKTNSMAEACRHMQMAYSKGWSIVKRAEEELGFLLMEGKRGGAGGGGMHLTREGANFLAQYRAWEAEVDQEVKHSFEKYFQ